MKHAKMDRRDFLTKSAAMTIGISVAVGAIAGCGPAPTGGAQTVTLDITQATNAALANINGGVKITVTGQTHPVMVTRTSATAVAAFSTKCTHMGCDVDLPSSTGVISCPCHGSQYDINGHVTGGPAPANLAAFAATLEGNIVTVTVS
jgi:cytochrome b6-f complex iron-sulfur subunit